MNASIYATILTGLGVAIILILTIHKMAKTNKQETIRRLDDLKKDIEEILDPKPKPAA